MDELVAVSQRAVIMAILGALLGHQCASNSVGDLERGKQTKLLNMIHTEVYNLNQGICEEEE